MKKPIVLELGDEVEVRGHIFVLSGITFTRDKPTFLTFLSPVELMKIKKEN